MLLDLLVHQLAAGMRGTSHLHPFHPTHVSINHRSVGEKLLFQRIRSPVSWLFPPPEGYYFLRTSSSYPSANCLRSPGEGGVDRGTCRLARPLSLDRRGRGWGGGRRMMEPTPPRTYIKFLSYLWTVGRNKEAVSIGRGTLSLSTAYLCFLRRCRTVRQNSVILFSLLLL